MRSLNNPMDLSKYDGIAIAVRGRPNRFKLILRDEEAWDGISWSYSFDVTSEERMQTIRIPFAEFRSTTAALD